MPVKANNMNFWPFLIILHDPDIYVHGQRRAVEKSKEKAGTM
jgi:hypothetical protein